MNNERSHIERLKKEVVWVFGRSLDSPTEFESLAEEIYEKTGEKISASTLKRVFGYLHYGSAPRKNTLAVLARYCGYNGWQDWCGRSSGEEEKKHRTWTLRYYIAGACAVVVGLIIFLLLSRQQAEGPAPGLPEAPAFSGEDDGDQQKYDRILQYCTKVALLKCDSVRLHRESMDDKAYSRYASEQYSRILNEMKALSDELCSEAFGDDEVLMRINSAQIFSICRENCLPLWVEVYKLQGSSVQ